MRSANHRPSLSLLLSSLLSSSLLSLSLLLFFFSFASLSPSLFARRSLPFSFFLRLPDERERGRSICSFFSFFSGVSLSRSLSLAHPNSTASIHIKTHSSSQKRLINWKAKHTNQMREPSHFNVKRVRERLRIDGQGAL